MTSYYDGLEFKTQLEARWAAFFDLVGWSWWANPLAIGNWRPDFKVKFRCEHSECGGTHTLLVAVLPFSNIQNFKDHPCLGHAYGVKDAEGNWRADAGAAFGDDPSVTQWEIAHGAGGGIQDIYCWVREADKLWAETEKSVSPAS
jgi:hypothetical protein